MRASFLLLAAFALILIGFVLVVAGTATSGLASGCFFWPFPIVVVCGAGAGGGPLYIFLVAGAVAVVLISVLSYIWMRRSIAPPNT